MKGAAVSAVATVPRLVGSAALVTSPTPSVYDDAPLEYPTASKTFVWDSGATVIDVTVWTGVGS